MRAPCQLLFRSVGLALVGLLGPPASAQVLRVCMNDEAHAPWRLAEPDGRVRRRGLDFVFLHELERRVGIRLEISPRPGRRCLKDLAENEQDAVLGMSHVPERDALARFPGPPGQPDAQQAVRRIEYVWYVRRASALRWDGARLHGLGPQESVGAQAGYSIAARLRSLGLRVEEGPRTVRSNLEMLRRGRVAALAMQPQAAEQVLASDPGLQRELRRLHPAVEERHYYLVFSHGFVANHAELARRLWQAALAVRDSDGYRAQQAQALRELNEGL